MKMTEETYKKFKSFTDYVVENASEEQALFLLAVLADACKFGMEKAKKEAKTHGKN